MIRFPVAIILLSSHAHAQFAVRVITISAPEIPAIRAAMNSAPDHEDALRKELLPYFIEPVSDTLVRCSPDGLSSIEVREETPYPTEYDPPDSAWNAARPRAFGWRNAGVMVHVEVLPGLPGGRPLITVDWNRTGDNGRNEFPLPGAPTSPPILQTRFTRESITAQVSVVSGQWRLLGMTRPMQAARPVPGPTQTLLTFVQVTESKPAAPAPPVAVANRYHFLSFRIPAAEGMNLALRPTGGDTALLDDMLRRAEKGDILLVGHAACPVSSGKSSSLVGNPKDSGGKKKEDPFAARVPGFAGAECVSLAEFPYPTAYDPNPRAFSARNIGPTLGVSDGRLHWEGTDDQVPMIAYSPQPEASAMTFPEFHASALRLYANPAPGTACLAGMTLLPDDGGPRMMRVCFFKNAGPPESATTVLSEAHFAAFSLTKESAGLLASVESDQQAARLRSLMDAGSARILAWQGVAGIPGTVAASEDITECPTAKGCKVKQHGAFLCPDSLEGHTLGDILELKFPVGPSPLTGDFTVTLNRPSVPTLDAFRAVAANGTRLPGFDPVKLTVTLKKDVTPPLKPGVPRLQLLPPLHLPPDHPDQGRRHVAVILLRP
jgi:hypothetical protein